MPTLEWIGKDKVVNRHLEVPYRVLDHQYTYVGGGENGAEIADGNKIIRGDNLEALKALLPQYEGKVKCIYIDPPYNTGNEGWVYNDNVNDPKIKKWLGQVVGKEGEDLSRHDKWLCMMYPRLKLLQRLLTDDGTIFISIDDNEQANLKLICDEIFGARNFIANVIRATGTHTGVGTQMIARETDYLLVYAKKMDSLKIVGMPLSTKDTKIYDMEDEFGRFLIRSLRRTGGENRREDRPNMYFPLTAPDGTVIYPIGPTGYESRWICVEETYNKFVQEHRILWKQSGKGGKWQVYQKFYLENRTRTISNLWSDIEGNKKATKDVRAIFGSNNAFDYPKPTQLIERILQLSSDPDSIILDSFAGSGTTAHAVLNLNKQDGSKRKFIIIEMMDYAETITAERVRRVIDGYVDVEGTDGCFSFYDLGEPLLLDNQTLNENVPKEKIRQYVFFMETKKPMGAVSEAEPYLLGCHQNAAYYFYYEKERIASLNHEFLAAVKTEAEAYVIYADINMLNDEELAQYRITFKKIPRDISRL